MGMKQTYLQRAREFKRAAAPTLRSEYLKQQYDDLCTLAESFDKVVEFINLNSKGIDLFPGFLGLKESEFIKEMLAINPFSGDSIKHPELEYIAQLVNEQEMAEKNIDIPVKWLALTSDQRKELVQKARFLVSDWRIDELETAGYLTDFNQKPET